MSKFALRQFLPQSLLGRSTLIVLIPVLILQVLTVYIFFERHWGRVVQRLAYSVAGEVAVMADAVDQGDDPAATAQRLNGYAAQSLDMTIQWLPGASVTPGYERGPLLKRLVTDQLAQGLMDKVNRPFAVTVADNEKKYTISVQLPKGVLMIDVLERRLYSSSSYVFLLWMVGISIFLTLVAMVFMRNQIRPIRKLAAAAERFGRGLDVENFKPEGAREVRAAATAFLEMRSRLKRQVEQRTLMLAGVSHDIRTPLTRLKLGLALLDNGDEVRALRDDVILMERMLSAYLEFVADGADERGVVTDIGELVNDVATRLSGDGADITVRTNDTVYLTVRPLAIARALQNIITNACRYGRVVEVTLTQHPTHVVITVADNGPGIDPEDYERALRPFVRLEQGRTILHGGVGLGLAIASDIMHVHGGTITLSRSATLGGLEVALSLPR